MPYYNKEGKTGHGESSARDKILRALRSGPLTRSLLAERLGISVSTCSTVLRQLLAEKLVEPGAPSDGRGAYRLVRPTPSS
jgi:DNA-binding IclR family transcriptional regulator